MPIVSFVNEKKEIQVPEGANLRKEAYEGGDSSLFGRSTRSQLPRLRHLRHLPRADHQGDGERQPDGAHRARAAEVLDGLHRP